MVGGRAFTTPDRTIYRVEDSRGKDVVFDTLCAQFGGVLVSDCLASYEDFPFTMHKCCGHHLKTIAQARDRKPEHQQSGATAVRADAASEPRLRLCIRPAAGES